MVDTAYFAQYDSLLPAFGPTTPGWKVQRKPVAVLSTSGGWPQTSILAMVPTVCRYPPFRV